VKVLLTGASSFTGAWFAESLRALGDQVVAALRGSEAQYAGTRLQRLSRLRAQGVDCQFECGFGSTTFIDIVRGGAFDVLCQHGANVENYKSPDFDEVKALADNTHGVRLVMRALKDSGVKAVVLTGSVFEQDEGAGCAPLRAVSPYGLSKGLTWQVFRHWSEVSGVSLYKFVIPNPFGPFEEPRFCDYLMGRWVRGQTAQVSTPDYVRDNIHVDLLGLAYADFVRRIINGSATMRFGPSGYVETQGAFARRFAQEIGSRMGLATPLEFGRQIEFVEPFSRINVDRVDGRSLGWVEDDAWDSLKTYYRAKYTA
jgi:nucleoside-diphosphate-sugar epimerase